MRSVDRFFVAHAVTPEERAARALIYGFGDHGLRDDDHDVEQWTESEYFGKPIDIARTVIAAVIDGWEADKTGEITDAIAHNCVDYVPDLVSPDDATTDVFAVLRASTGVARAPETQSVLSELRVLRKRVGTLIATLAAIADSAVLKLDEVSRIGIDES